MEIRTSEKAQNSYRLIKWIGLFHLGGIFLYAMIFEALEGSCAPGQVVVSTGLLRSALVVISVLVFFSAGYLRRRILWPSRLASAVDQALVPGERLQRMVRATTLSFVLCDVVALFGMVIFFLGGTRTDFYLFLVLAAIFLAIQFPAPEQWQHWYSARGRFR